MHATQLRLINLPWQLNRADLAHVLSKICNTKIRYSKIDYDKQTGLSRGTAIVRLDSDRITRDIIRRGELDINGRRVIALKSQNKETQQE